MVMNYNISNEFLQYIEYLYSIGCTLDENGNIVPIEKDKTLTLTITVKEDDDE